MQMLDDRKAHNNHIEELKNEIQQQFDRELEQWRKEQREAFSAIRDEVKELREECKRNLEVAHLLNESYNYYYDDLTTQYI